ncbi:hypothetical protein VCHA28FP16_180069 [Vibrio chagasii]|nr:hypothetical protein VCHA28FP16_180069 [Vibrio chagasii]
MPHWGLYLKKTLKIIVVKFGSLLIGLLSQNIQRFSVDTWP